MDESLSRDGKKFSFLVEREKLHNNLEIARRMAEEVFVLTHQLEMLLGEIEARQHDTRLLKVQLNRAAIRYGLKPIPIKSRKPRKKRPV